MKHVPALDGVRGLAILLVMWHHMTVLLPDSPVDEMFGDLGNIGWIGVDLFFVLSGYLITSILRATKGADRYFTRFYWRRFLRIFPLYYLLVSFSLLVLPHVHHPKMANFARIEGDEFYYWTFLSNYSVAYAGAFRHAILDISWSLAIEEQFYLVWPWIVFACSTRRLVIVCLTLIGTATVLRGLAALGDVNAITAYVLTPLRVDSIAYGALIAIVMQNEHWSAVVGRNALKCMIPLMAIVGVLWNLNSFSYYEASTRIVGFSAVAATGALLIAKVVHEPSGRVARLFSSPFMRVFGVYSYALYLFHLPIRGVVRDVIFRPEQLPQLLGSHLPGQLIFYAVATGLSLGAAMISWKLIEQPLLRLKGSFEPPNSVLLRSA